MTRTEKNLTNDINFLRSALSSLKSCKRDEISNEKRILVNAINAVKLAQIEAGTASTFNDRAVNMIGEAMKVMQERTI